MVARAHWMCIVVEGLPFSPRGDAGVISSFPPPTSGIVIVL